MNKKLFEKIYGEYFQKLGRYAFVILKDKELAEEAVQQVFCRIWEQSDSLQIEKIYPYLIRSTKNEALKLLKLRKTTLLLNKSEYEDSNWQEVDDNDDDTFMLIKQAIKSLPPKCREIMILKVEDGLTHKEISEYLNISVKTIENQVSIAFKRMRESIKK